MNFKAGDIVRFADNAINRRSECAEEQIGKSFKVEYINYDEVYLVGLARPVTGWWYGWRFEKVEKPQSFIVLGATESGSLGLVKQPCQFDNIDDAKALASSVARDQGKAFVVKIVAEAEMPKVDPVFTDLA